MNSTDTSDLVALAAGGDRQAYGILVNRHAAMVTGVAYAVCGDFARSEDVGQEAFIEAWKNLSSLREPDKFVAWICTIARRRAIDAIRSDRTSRTTQSIHQLPTEVSDPRQQNPETTMAQEQERAMIWSMLERLPDTYREPMVLFYRSEQSTREVAIALGENETTIRQRLSRGRELLRTEVSETLRKTLSETAPKAAFAAIVTASLPSVTYAASATTTATVATGKSSSLGSATTSSVVGGAAFGSLIGLLGGVYGSWMSWKNCEYVSQQKFLIQQIRTFVIASVITAILFSILLYARLNGFLSGDATYGFLLTGLLLGFQVFNIPWILRGIRGYQQLGEQAKATGEPMRESVREQMEMVREQTRVIRDDGAIGYEVFRWNAGGWAGACIGSLAWMLPVTVFAFQNGSVSTASIALASVCTGSFVAWKMWSTRHRLDAYVAIQWWLVIVGALSTVVFAALQFLTDAVTQQACQWTPWAWWLLLLLPVISLQLRRMRRSFEKNMLRRTAEASDK
ncbi:MAG: sigma-70 family RNA polymerase sigma factor [Planctomycetaceae bacterium]